MGNCRKSMTLVTWFVCKYYLDSACKCKNLGPECRNKYGYFDPKTSTLNVFRCSLSAGVSTKYYKPSEPSVFMLIPLKFVSLSLAENGFEISNVTVVRIHLSACQGRKL